MKRYLHSLFCDDIRQEVGNKLSLMGIYQHVLNVPQMPAQLQKLCVLFSASTLADDPFRSLTFVIMRNDEILVEQKLSPDELLRFENHTEKQESASNGQLVQTVQVIIVMANLKIDEPCLFRVRARTEREELKAPGLWIALMPSL